MKPVINLGNEPDYLPIIKLNIARYRMLQSVTRVCRGCRCSEGEGVKKLVKAATYRSFGRSGPPPISLHYLIFPVSFQTVSLVLLIRGQCFANRPNATQRCLIVTVYAQAVGRQCQPVTG